MTRPSSRRSFIISVTPCCSCAASYLLISKIVKANDTMRCQAECCLGIRVCGFMPALARKIKGAQSADWCQCPWAVVQLGSTFFWHGCVPSLLLPPPLNSFTLIWRWHLGDVSQAQSPSSFTSTSYKLRFICSNLGRKRSSVSPMLTCSQYRSRFNQIKTVSRPCPVLHSVSLGYDGLPVHSCSA